MSERQTHCPACKSLDVKVQRLLNPETHDLNCKALIFCMALGCGHSWEGWVTSPWTEEQRAKGFSI
jgi:hypothetical protein